MIHCCEAPRSMLFYYFGKKQLLRGTFGEIWSIQIQIYLKTYVELKYGACYLKSKVSAHRSVMLEGGCQAHRVGYLGSAMICKKLLPEIESK